MRFIHHHHGIFAHPRVKFHFLKQDAVGHDFYFCRFICLVFKTHLVADQSWIRCVQLLCDEFTYTHCCNAAWLGYGYDAVRRISCLVQDDRNLCCLSAAGRTLNDNHLIFCKCVKNALLLFIDWETFVIYCHSVVPFVFSIKIFLSLR